MQDFGGRRKNVVGKVGNGERYILIGAHYDGQGPGMPSASDNASGVAVVIELVRELKSKELPVSLVAVAFDDAGTRSRAMFIASGFPDDEALRNRALLAGIAAAECVNNEQQRSELFLLLRPGVASLATDVRRELTRAVERMKAAEIKQHLYDTLGRFFVYERPRETEDTSRATAPAAA